MMHSHDRALAPGFEDDLDHGRTGWDHRRSLFRPSPGVEKPPGWVDLEVPPDGHIAGAELDSQLPAGPRVDLHLLALPCDVLERVGEVGEHDLRRSRDGDLAGDGSPPGVDDRRQDFEVTLSGHGVSLSALPVLRRASGQPAPRPTSRTAGRAARAA